MEITDFTSLIESPINSLLKSIGNEVKQVTKNRLLEYQTNEFKRNFYSKTLLHRSEPVKLTEFYIPLKISKINLTNNYQKTTKKYSTEDVKSLFSKTNFITLIGNAGSGKSTIIKYLFINSVQTNFKIPIKIELRYLNDYEKSLSDYIFEEIFLYNKLGITIEIIERLLNSNSFIFFFDGYDEVNSSIKESFTKELDKFVSRFSKNYFIITSRPYTNIEILPSFTNYIVCELEGNEITEFVKKQTSNAEEELSEKIIKAIDQIDNRSYKIFLQNPLLLSMFILTFQSYSEIPQKRSEFYKQVFDTLYSVHDSVSKLSYVREKISGLSREKFEEILKLFSFISYFEGKFLFQKEYLDEKLNLIKAKKIGLEYENDKIIQDLQIAIGILNKEGIEYTFPHRSLQEYFAANYISSLSDERKKIVFGRIKEIIENKWMYLVENYHFFLLLSEQDYNSVVKHIALPLLENQIIKSKKTDLEIDDYYDIHCKIYIIGVELLQETIRKEKLHDEFCKQTFLHDAIYLGNNKFNHAIMNNDKKTFTARTIEMQKILIKNGELWVDKIRENLIKDERSDDEIIGII